MTWRAHCTPSGNECPQPPPTFEKKVKKRPPSRHPLPVNTTTEKKMPAQNGTSFLFAILFAAQQSACGAVDPGEVGSATGDFETAIVVARYTSLEVVRGHAVRHRTGTPARPGPGRGALPPAIAPPTLRSTLIGSSTGSGENAA